MANEFLALAPTVLRNNRRRRYQGDDMSLPMSAFVAGDQKRIRALYDFLLQLFELFDSGGNCTEETVRRLQARASTETVRTLYREARELGYDSAANNPTELFAKVVHDLRGGGLNLLLARLQFAQTDGWKIETARAVFFLVRDHLKIMRNALLGLDDQRRAIDMQPKLHRAELILEKWQNALLVREESQTRLVIESLFHGHISESCVEFGALDRILYNLINNACRHAASDTIRMYLVPLANENVRFILSNSLTSHDRRDLEHRDLRALFKPGISSTTSGFGLTIVADFVANAYGLISRERALEGGYVGAKVEGDQFLAWFHWPVASDV